MKIKKNQRPIEIDAHLKYVCPNKDCRFHHWISIRESSIKNFRIVCECGQIFSPKQIRKLKIIFTEKTAPKINEKLIENCVSAIIGYGFTKEEATHILTQQHIKNPKLESIDLIKLAIKNFGENT